MSTKSSIILTDDSEHWYYEHIDDTVEIEINHNNIVGDIYDDGFSLSIAIKPNCHLWRCLQTMKQVD